MLIFGCGYLGHRVAERLLRDESAVESTAQGAENSAQGTAPTVYAVTRATDRAEQFQQQGLSPIVADTTDRTTLDRLPAAETVLVAVGFDRHSGKSIHQTYVDGLGNILDSISPDTQRVIYISSTGVYGDGNGTEIDEDSPCYPVRDGGQACLDAEKLLEAHPRGENAVVLRLAGIYGPDRIPRSVQLVNQEPLPVDPDTYLNLIHVDDAVSAVLAAARLPGANSLRRYCISDGHPIRRGDYFSELARQLGTPPPEYAAPGETKKQRGAGNKRISNARMRAELDFTLSYPTWPDGLAAILAGSS